MAYVVMVMAYIVIAYVVIVMAYIAMGGTSMAAPAQRHIQLWPML